MPDSNYNIGLTVTSKSDDSGLERVIAELERLNSTQEKALAATTKHKDALKEATAAADEHGNALSGLATKVAGYIAAFIGIDKIIGWLKQGTEESIAQERALLQLSNTAKAFGLDGDAAAKAAKDLAEALAAKGFEETQTLQTVARLLPLTKDYNEAIAATTLVSEIATARQMDYGTASTIVLSLIGGTARGLIQAHRLLGVEATTTQGALDELTKEMAKEAAGIHDTKMEVDSATASWHELWKALGDRVTPVLRWLAENTLPTMTFFLKALPTVIEDVKERFVMWVSLLGKVDLAHPVDSLRAALKQYNTDELTFEAHSMARWLKLGKEVEDYKKKLAEPPPGTGGKVTSHGAEKPGAIGPPDAQDNSDAEAWMAWRAKIWQKIAQQDLDADKKRRAAKLQSIKDEEKAEQDSANKVDKIHADLTNKYKHWTVQELADKIAELKKIEMDEATSALTRKQIAADLAEFKKMLDGLVAENAAKKQEMAIQSALSAAAGAFPQIKEFAVAESIMNTYQAATKALAEGGPYLGPILAAIIVAAGLANVAKIESTEPGSGGGVSAGGSAATPIAMPAVTPATSGSAGSTVTTTNVANQNAPASVVNIHVNALDTTNALRAAQRAWRPASRQYDRTIGSRASTTIGSRR